MLWFIILTTVMNNGDVYTDVRPATSPEYNNEQTCKEVGAVLVEQEQIKIGTNSGKVYFVCDSFSKEAIKKAFTVPGQNL